MPKKVPTSETKKSSGRAFKSGKQARRRAWQEEANRQTERAVQSMRLRS